MKCVKCGKENSTYVCDECRAKGEITEESSCLDSIGGALIIFIIFVVIASVVWLISDFPKTTQKSTTTYSTKKISQATYKKIDSWLMNYYVQNYNSDSWYVKSTSLKYGDTVVINLVATQYDYVQTLKNDRQSSINFALSVCPNDSEEIYNLINKKQIDVDIFDQNGNLVTAYYCSN